MNRLLVAAALLALAMMAVAAIGLGADPTASPSVVPADVIVGGDLRSEGEGPGLVGNPLLILVAVVGLGLATAAVTVLLVRLTQRDSS